MKTILILSSIFYILGLKIGNKIDLVKRCNPVEKIASQTKVVKEATKTFYFSSEARASAESDSLKNEKEKIKPEKE